MESSDAALAQEPRLVIAFHEEFDPEKGGTSDSRLRALLLGIPVWLTPGPDPDHGLWLSSDQFPEHRAAQLQRQLDRTPRSPPRPAPGTGTL